MTLIQSHEKMGFPGRLRLNRITLAAYASIWSKQFAESSVRPIVRFLKDIIHRNSNGTINIGAELRSDLIFDAGP
jgi:hypothetical protein